MIIEELHVKNFGKLQDTKVPLKEGLNLIYGANESGKTTLHTFLKCMLFGIHRSRGRGAAKDIYSRYEPWEYSHYYAGSMYFSSGDKLFRLDRNFQKDNVQAELFCMTDGEKLSVKRGDLDMLLGNISEIVYDNTISIGQTKGVTDQDLALELRNYMANYQGTGDSDLNLGKTMKILKNQKKAIQGEIQLNEAREDVKKNESASQVLYLRQEIQELEKKIPLERQQLRQLEHQQQALEISKKTGGQEILKKQISRRRIVDLFLVIAIVFLAAATAFLPGLFKVGSILTDILLLIGCFIYRRKLQRKILSTREHLLENREMLLRQIERIKGRLHNQEEDLKEKKINQDSLTRKLHEYNQEIRGKTSLDEEVEGIDLAIEVINIIGQRLQNQIGSQICNRTSEVLAEMTGGKYHQVVVEKDLQMGVSTRERYIPVEQLSRGTMEQVYFALRMAVGDVLCSQEPLPVVLDDVFAMYDEKRLMETLQWLIEHKQQVLLFTCHKREEQILNTYGMPYHRVGIFDP